MAVTSVFGFQLPAFVPSVSSVKDDHAFEDYLRLFNALGAPLALTSAYDWHHLGRERRETATSEYFDWTAGGGRMVLDSGWYEAYWHRDQDWIHDAYIATALELMPLWAMSFDVPEEGRQRDSWATTAIRNWERDQSALADTPVVPIVHGDLESLPAAVREVAIHTSSPLVAIPERELGAGVIARARTVRAVRDALEEASSPCHVHLLGTGSPTSVLAYTLAGAGSFDGLEWNRTVVDFQTARLYHSQHFDFFEHQSEAAGTGSYWGRTLTHNLIFWQQWMRRIRQGEGPAMFSAYAPESGHQLLAGAIPGVFE